MEPPKDCPKINEELEESKDEIPSDNILLTTNENI